MYFLPKSPKELPRMVQSSERRFAVIVRDLGKENFTEGMVVSDERASDEEINQDELDYMLLCRAKIPESEDMDQKVTEVLGLFGASDVIEIRPLTLEPSLVTRKERNSMKELFDGDIGFHSMFVGFPRGSDEGRESALEIISISITRSRWQFWR